MTETNRPLRPRHQHPHRLADLAELVGGGLRPGQVSVPVTGITNRSGDVQPGDLWAAVPGTRTHGARFADQAIDRGAAAILTDDAGAELLGEHCPLPVLVVPEASAVLGPVAARVYGDPSRSLRILGITATSGKTTTAYLIRAGLMAAGHRVGLVGTVETRIGDRVIAHTAGSSFTTPEAPDLQALLAVMLEEGVSHVVMEVSSHALQLGRVGAITFDVAGFGNLSQDHLDFHHTMAEYFAAKALLFDGRADCHVVNIDDPAGRRIAALRPKRTVSVSATGAPGADWQVTERSADSLTGSEFVARHGAQTQRVRIALPGEFNVDNALLALAMLAEVGVPPQIAASALAGVGVPGRMERVDRGQDFLAIVDYAHKPAAVEAVLAALRPQTTGRLILVLGCGGDRDAGKRPLMGEAGARHADVLIVTDDNPRSEPPESIRAQMLAGAKSVPRELRAELHEVDRRRAAIRLAVSLAAAGDTVLVAGKGHEQGQYVAGVVHEFDDRVELAAAITDAAGGPAGVDPSAPPDRYGDSRPAPTAGPEASAANADRHEEESAR